MKYNNTTIAIVLASGTGERFDDVKIKQYQIINKKAVIYHSVKAFIANPLIDEVVVVINKSHEKFANKHLKSLNIKNIIFGGKTRQLSVYNALKYIKKFNPKKVLIHDSVRPNIQKNIIMSIINYLDKYNAVIPVVKISDSVKEISNNIIEAHINRKKLALAQTPQGFSYNKIMDKHKNTNKKNINDDASLFNKVYTVPGHINNLKITNKEDLNILKTIMKKKERKYIQISALGIDVHKFDTKKSKSILIGGINLKFHKKLLGHSDSDVVLHALVDSILGCVSAGDIGTIFPDKEPKWKNANSNIFVDYALSVLNKNNCILLHTDITIICEEPKISPYKDKIKNNIAKLLKISNKNISIKATTSEGLGFTGRKEGIMAQCLTTISKPI